MKSGPVVIHVIPLAAAADAGECFLTAGEKARAGTFRFPEDARRWTKSRNALRRILGEAIGVSPGEVPLVLTEFGKPLLAEPFGGLSFSLSHCNDLALIALCKGGAVGIDLEPLDRAHDLTDCESTFCHPAEVASLPDEPEKRRLRLLEIWTAKEALLKALGTGFSHPPEKVCIKFGEPVSTAETPLPGAGGLAIHRLRHPALDDYCASLAAPASIQRIEIIDFAASTSELQSVITAPPTQESNG